MIDIAYAAEVAHEAAKVAETASPLGQFGVNGKMFIAQLVNFVIVLLILWKWVFTPTLKTLKERTDKIEKSLDEAAAIEKERRSLEAEKVEELYKAREQGKEVIALAKSKSDKIADVMRIKAKQEVAEVVAGAKAQIAQEREQMKAELREETMVLAVAVAEKVLAKKLDKNADAELIKQALKEVK